MGYGMKRKSTVVYKVLLGFSLLALSGCGNYDFSLPACFPFACQPTPAPPSVSTEAATAVTADSAALNGLVNPNWKDTGAWFEWGTDPTLSSYSPTSSQFLGSGDTTYTISVFISGLNGSTTYYYRAVAYNVLGTSKGEIMSFTTP